jgi:hypothetical protein
MPKYKKYFLMNSIFSLSDVNTSEQYSYQKYLQYSMIEYSKLSRYMSHCSSRGLDLDYFDGDFHILLHDFDNFDYEETYTQDCLQNVVNIPFNKSKIRSIRRTRMSLLHYRNKIYEQNELLKSSEMMLQETYRNRIENEPIQMYSSSDILQTYIHKLEDDVDYMKQRLELCRTIQFTQTELKIDVENLRKYKLIDDLHMRSIEFCMPELEYFGKYGHIQNDSTTKLIGHVCETFDEIARQIPICTPRFQLRSHMEQTSLIICQQNDDVCKNTENLAYSYTGFLSNYRLSKFESKSLDITKILPEVLVDIIYSFIGNDTLENVRKKCVMDRYFPNGRDDVFKMLKPWRNIELFHFSKHVFLCYDFNFERKRWKRVNISKSSNKTVIIENILRCQYCLTFYDFLRDVFFLSQILQNQRRNSGCKS